MNELTYLLFYTLVTFQAHTLVKEDKVKDTRIKIAVIDTGFESSRIPEAKDYLCKGNVHFDQSGEGLEDFHGHGTNIAGIIGKGLDTKKYCIVIIKYWAPTVDKPMRLTKCLELVGVMKDVKYVNLSTSGNGSFPQERTAIARILRNKVHFTVSAGNAEQNLNKVCDFYPPCYSFNRKYFHVVGNGLNNKHPWSNSNYGDKIISEWRNGVKVCALGYCPSGTSQAAAVFTRDLIKQNDLKLDSQSAKLKNEGE